MSHIVNPKIEEIVAFLKQKEVFDVTPDTTLFDVAVKLKEKDVTGLPVIEEGRIVGVITEQVFSRKVVPERIDYEFVTASALMAPGRSVVKVNLQTTTKDALELMDRNHIRHLPVVDDQDVVVAFLSQRGIFRALDYLEDTYLDSQKSLMSYAQ